MDKARVFWKRHFNILSRLLVIVLALALISPRAYAASSTMSEAKEIIKAYYVKDIPDSLLDSASSVDEMVNSLGDPHSSYFTADEYKEFTNSINNTFSGIGIYLDIVPEGIKVVSVIENSPAKEAGIVEGDIITEAGGVSLSGMSSEEAVTYVKGPDGTSVHLSVKRGDSVLSYDVVRRAITEPTVTGGMIGNLAYIELYTFGEDTSVEFGKLLSDLKKNNPSGYIIDLRNNPGGYLLTAVDLAGYFIPGNPALLVRDRSGYQDTYSAPSTYEPFDKPVVFLINGNSASASEILTSAVKDYKKAFVIGSTSYGKGTVQSMFQLSDGSVLKITVYNFFSPLGNIIDKVGITPDLETGYADPLKAAELLLGDSSGSSDKTGYIKVGIEGQSFEIDLKKAELPGYKEAYSCIMDKAAKDEEIYLGTNSGWSQLSGTDSSALWQACFPGYDETPSITNVPVDKRFTINFSSDIDASSLKDGDIQLVDMEDGKDVVLSFENVDAKSIKALPEADLKAGGRYMLFINDSIRSKDGASLPKGVITYITVQN